MPDTDLVYDFFGKGRKSHKASPQEKKKKNDYPHVCHFNARRSDMDQNIRPEECPETHARQYGCRHGCT